MQIGITRSALGKQYIKLYYSNAAELTSLVIFSGSIRAKMIAALKAIAPAIRKSMNSHQLTINPFQMQKAKDLIQAVKKVASPKLSAAISRLESDLNNGSLGTEFFTGIVK